MSIELEQKLDYNENLWILLEQYKDSEKLQSFMKAFNDELTKLEEAVFELRDNFYLNTAEGVQLDAIGAIFNETRQGRDDVEFRAAIAAKAVTFYSGRPEDLFAQIKSLYGATVTKYHETYDLEPASFLLVTDGNVTKADLDRMSPAGVNGYVGKYLIQNESGNKYIETISGQKLIIKSEV